MVLKVKIKICGITKLEDALLCSILGADAIGFIFYSKSKRFLEYEIAKKIISSLPFFVQKVGVFVNENLENINNISKDIGLNIVQLHGDEDQQYINQINLPVIKALRINSESDFNQLNNFSNCKILLDAYCTREYGGTGNKFDWSTIPYEIRSKIILSGGINTSDLEYIFSDIKPEAIDLSSSIEILPGIKDHKKLKRLFTEYRKLRGY